MNLEIKFSQFRGKPLIKIPKSVPTANFLKGDFGEAVFEEYKGRAKADYGDADALRVLSYSEGVVSGSNPFAFALINRVVRKNGLRTATPADLERILRTDALDLVWSYEDSALVLRSEGEPESYHARNLAGQLRLRDRKIKLPIMIPLAGLDLERDNSSDYGLAFKLREDAEIIDASILDKDGQFSKADEKTGLPKKLGYGARSSYTRNSGLSRFILDVSLDLNSGEGDDLVGSDCDGRVVVVSDGVKR